MGVRMRAEGLVLDMEWRADEKAEGPGFISGAILPDGSRETLEFWSFGDNLAGEALVGHFEAHGVSRVCIEVEIRAKLNRSGVAILTTGLKGYVGADGAILEGQRDQPGPKAPKA